MNKTFSSVLPKELKELLYKIIVVGDIGVGKSCLVQRYVYGTFNPRNKSTIGVDFAMKTLRWDENTSVRAHLWDIAGQARFGAMTKTYYKGAQGAFILYDVSREITFESVSKWKDDLDYKLGGDGGSIPMVLLANKIDLLEDEAEVSKARLDEFCKKHGFIGWFGVSAKENIGLSDAVNMLISEMIKNQPEEEEDKESGIVLKVDVEEKESSCC